MPAPCWPDVDNRVTGCLGDLKRAVLWWREVTQKSLHDNRIAWFVTEG
jgi:hypothetical protein